MGSGLLHVNKNWATMEAKKEKLKTAFSKVDKTNEGKITYTQMKDVLTDFLGENPGEIFCEMADYNKDKMISYKELLLFFFNTNLPFEEFAKAAFKMCDTSGDGFVDTKEIYVMFRLGRKAGQGSARDCRVLVAMFDEDDDRKLNFDEFCNMIKDGQIL